MVLFQLMEEVNTTIVKFIHEGLEKIPPELKKLLEKAMPRDRI
jgi:hypothetical protein